MSLVVQAVFADDGRLATDDSYQDDFETPGISPLSASPRKHNRQMPNLRRYARGRPQILQRLCWRVENFGFLTFCGLTLLSAPSFTLFAVVAITPDPSLRSGFRRSAPTPRKRLNLAF